MDELRQIIIQKYKAGISVRKIQEEVRKSVAYIYHILRDEGLSRKIGKLSLLQSNQIKKLYCEEKLSMGEIGNIIGINPETVGRILKQLKVTKTPKQLSREKENSIIAMYNEGCFLWQIRDYVGVGTSRILRVLKDRGVPYKTRRENYSNDEIKRVLNFHYDGMSPWQIAKEIGVNRQRVAKLLKSIDINCNVTIKDNRDYPVNHGFLDAIDTPEKAYFLGFMVTDGTISPTRNSIRLTLSIKDVNILEVFTQWIQPTKPLCFHASHGFKYVTMSIESQVFKENLIRHGCHPRKTYTLEYPQNLREELQRHFLRGVLDGDGCIYYNKKQKQPAIIFAGTHMFLKGVAEKILQNTGAIGKLIHNPENHDVIYTLVYLSIRRCQDLTQWLYKDSSVYLERKYKKYLTVQTMTGARPL